MGHGYNTWALMTERWAEEYRFHNFDTEELQEETLHFTQVVWKSTVSIGK
jgi:hypothetical protein